MTKPIVAAGQVTDAGQGVWLSGNGGFILDVTSAKKVEKLLGDKRGFFELRKQKGVYVIACEDPPSGLFPLSEKELDQRKQMDRDDVEVEEGRPAKVKSAPVLPTEKGGEEHEVTHATFRSGCVVCLAGRATDDAHTRSSNESSVPSLAMDCGFFGRNADADLATILVLVQRPHGVAGSLPSTSQRTRAPSHRLRAGLPRLLGFG